MIKRDKLLKLLNKVIEQETKLIPLFSRHIPSAVSFSGLSEQQQQNVSRFFQQRAVTQAKHLEVLKEIRDSVEKKGNDVY